MIFVSQGRGCGDPSGRWYGSQSDADGDVERLHGMRLPSDTGEPDRCDTGIAALIYFWRSASAARRSLLLLFGLDAGEALVVDLLFLLFCFLRPLGSPSIWLDAVRLDDRHLIGAGSRVSVYIRVANLC